MIWIWCKYFMHALYHTFYAYSSRPCFLPPDPLHTPVFLFLFKHKATRASASPPPALHSSQREFLSDAAQPRLCLLLTHAAFLPPSCLPLFNIVFLFVFGFVFSNMQDKSKALCAAFELNPLFFRGVFAEWHHVRQNWISRQCGRYVAKPELVADTGCLRGWGALSKRGTSCMRWGTSTQEVVTGFTPDGTSPLLTLRKCRKSCTIN